MQCAYELVQGIHSFDVSRHTEQHIGSGGDGGGRAEGQSSVLVGCGGRMIRGGELSGCVNRVCWKGVGGW